MWGVMEHYTEQTGRAPNAGPKPRRPHAAGAGTGPVDRLREGLARRLDRGRARFREWAGPGWSWRRVVVALVLGEAAAVLLLLLVLAITGKALVVSFERPGASIPAGPSPRLTIPVAGVLATDLEDDFGAPRTPTRSHLGIDIRAPAGTPVVAAAAGTIVRLDESRNGGTTIHQRSLDGRTIFYYAHLQRRVAGLRVGDLVRRGDTIAFVGESGNAKGIPHLHFATYVVADPNEVSNGHHFDPYPLLVEAAPEPDTP